MLKILLPLLWLFTIPLNSLANTWPAQPLKLVVQFPPGTTTDAVARDVAKRLSTELEQSVFVVNQPGGGGTIGVNEIAKSKPDGYTLGTVNMPTLAIIPHTQGTPYDPLTAFTHLAVVGPYNYGIFVTSDSPWATFSELAEHVKQNPNKYAYGTLAPGTTNQLMMERLSNTLGLEWNYIPYKGDTESIMDLLAGRIMAINASPTTTLPQVAADKIRMLASTGPTRWQALPEIPTLTESDVVDYSQQSYLSLAAPAGLDPEAEQVLTQALQKILTDPEVIENYEQQYGQPVQYQTGDAYAEIIRDEYDTWGQTLRGATEK